MRRYAEEHGAAAADELFASMAAAQLAAGAYARPLLSSI
jgi:hypothetical protein